jgi:hypothetical protein
MMMHELSTLVDSLVPECVTTQEVEARLCARCGEGFTASKFHPKQRYCSRFCQHNIARDLESEMLRELKSVTRNIAFAYLNRDKSFSFDGRYEGPLNKSVTFEVKIAKDKGYHPMPIDVHVRAIEPKFNHVTPEDVDWGRRQGRPTQTMPRKHNTFCAVCVEMVIDENEHRVRVTKGLYLPIEHQCNSVRVYDLRGNLLEVKPL